MAVTLGSTDPVTCLVDQRLNFWQYARNNSFGPRRIWLEIAYLLKLRIVYKGVVKCRVEQHIVPAGKTENIAAKAVFCSSSNLV